AAALQDVNSAVSAIDHNTQQNAAMVEQTSAAGRSLADEAEQLNTLLDSFTLEGGASGVTDMVRRKDESHPAADVSQLQLEPALD
ncbi:methyl-accepting chemotaxis protein, partial [Komagataeibacter melaceti]